MSASQIPQVRAIKSQHHHDPHTGMHNLEPRPLSVLCGGWCGQRDEGQWEMLRETGLSVLNWIPSLWFCLGVIPPWERKQRKHCLPEHAITCWSFKHLLSKKSYPYPMWFLARGIQVSVSLLCMFAQMFSRTSRYSPALSGACDFQIWLEGATALAAPRGFH